MNRSVCIFVLFALLATVIGRPNGEQSESIEQKCIAETGIDPALLDNPPTSDAPWDDGLKCFFACTLKKHGALKEDGSFDLEKTISEISDDLTDEEEKKTAIGAATACADKKGDDECETAHRILLCLRDYTIAHLDDSDDNN